jgi:hypothetical protein
MRLNGAGPPTRGTRLNAAKSTTVRRRLFGHGRHTGYAGGLPEVNDDASAQ